MERIGGSLPEIERQELVERLVTDPIFSHGVFGRFEFGKSGGHFLQEMRGPDASTLQLFHDESLYENLFGRKTGGVEFRARVLFGSADQGQGIFVIAFNDRQGDHRPGSHTDYLLVLPKTEVDSVRPLVEEDPSVLIDVFKRIYPGYDRSEGKLTLDPECLEICRV